MLAKAFEIIAPIWVALILVYGTIAVTLIVARCSRRCGSDRRGAVSFSCHRSRGCHGRSARWRRTGDVTK